MLPEAEQALHDALATSRLLTTVPGVGRGKGMGIGHVVAVFPDGSRVVAADLDNKTASIRDADTLEKLVTLAGHTRQVLAVGVSPKGRLVVTGSADGTARLWNASTGRAAHVLHAHRGGVLATRFSADGTRLATLGTDGAARVWDVRTGRKLRSFPNVHERTAVRSAWGEGVAFVGRDRIAVAPFVRGSAPSPIVAKVFDVSSGKQVKVVKDPRGDTLIFDVDVSPDGRLLIAGRAEGTELQLYELPSGKQLDVVRAAHGIGVLDVEFSSDGRLVATGGVDATAKVWEGVEQGRLHAALTVYPAAAAGSVSLGRRGSRLFTWATPSHEVRRWDVSPAGRGEVLTLPGPDTGVHPDIAFTPDGRRLVATSGREGTVGVWSTDTGRLLFALEQHKRARAVVGIDISPDGARIATAGADGSARIFDADTGKQLLVVPHLHCLPRHVCRVNRAVFSPDGARIATTGLDNTVRILDALTGRQLRVLGEPKQDGFGTYPVAWRPDGRQLLAMAPSGTVIWDAHTFRKLLALPGTGTPATSVVWSPDGRQVLLEAGAGVQVRDASSGKLLRTLDTPGVSELAFSRDGSRLAVGTVFTGDYVIRIVDWPSGRGTLVLRPGARRVAFSPDGKLLAGVRQRTGTPFVHVWALDTELLLRKARSRVTRALTEEECRRYLQRSCPDGR
jgi:WD40 repeat protein